MNTRYLTFDGTGRIIGVIPSDPSIIQFIVPPGLSYLASEVGDIDTHWISGNNQVVEYSPQGKQAILNSPGDSFNWSPSLETWLDTRDISGLKQYVVERLKNYRDTLLFGGFTWDNSKFDSDATISQPRLLGIYTMAIAGDFPVGGYEWRLADNTWRTLSDTDAIAVWNAFQSFMSNLFAAFAVHEQTVLAESDIEVVRNYDITSNWPQ